VRSAEVDVDTRPRAASGAAATEAENRNSSGCDFFCFLTISPAVQSPEEEEADEKVI
jgi:hypothetical protein